MKISSLFIAQLLLCLAWQLPAWSQENPLIHYTISVPQPASHQYHVALRTSGWSQDTLILKMPEWMPGYYW